MTLLPLPPPPEPKPVVRMAVCQDGVVVNIIMASVGDTPPEGCTLIELPDDSSCDLEWTCDAATESVAP